MAQQNYKVVPLDADQKTVAQKAHELREYLVANIEVNIADGDLNKAAVFQQHHDTLMVLIEHSRDRVS